VKKHFIIHPCGIEQGIGSGSVARRAKCIAAFRLINAVIEGANKLVEIDAHLENPVLDANVYFLKTSSAFLTEAFIATGDHIVIYGAYADICCAKVQKIAQQRGASAEICEQGTMAELYGYESL
jgi:hypothetical protein